MILALNTPKRFQNAVLDILKTAKDGDHVILNYFVIRSDKAGISLLLNAYAASMRGADIDIIVDDYGSLHPGDAGTEYDSPPLSKEVLQVLQEGGVRVHVYHQIQSTRLLSPQNIMNWKRYSRRNHNKNCVFALNSIGKLGLIVGDAQWTDDHFGPNFRGHNVYVENEQIYFKALAYTNQVLRSNAVSSPNDLALDREKLCLYQQLFKDYRSVGPTHWFHWTWYRGMELIIPDDIQFVASDIEFDDPIKRHTIQQYEIDLLQDAKRRVIYSTPYFCPDSEMQKAFRSLQKKRHLDFKILMAKYDCSTYLPYGAKRAASKLLQDEINIYRFNGKGNFHYKDMVVDDVTFIKTANGEGRSRFFNLETGVIIKSRQFTEINLKYINWDLKKSTKLTPSSRFITEPRLVTRLIRDTLCPLYYHHL